MLELKHIFIVTTKMQTVKLLCLHFLGLADVYNMHSAEEKVDYNTLLKGYEVIKNTFEEFNK